MTSCIAGLTLPLVDALHTFFQSPSSVVGAFFVLLHELRGTGDQTSLHPCLLDICAALLYYIHGPETP